MVRTPVPSAVDVYLTEQLALAAPVIGSTLPAASWQLAALKFPLPLLVKVTLPVGMVAAPGVLSLTVAVQPVDSPTAMAAGAQPTLVVVALVVVSAD